MTGGEAGKSDEITVATSFAVIYGNNVLSAPQLEVSLLGVGTVPRLERDARSNFK